jgi:hypothetical protein
VTGEEVDARCALAPRLLDFACIGASDKGGNYLSVVEGRDWPGYSSCADLAHWLLYRLGCRQSWINRYEHNVGDLGEPGWDSQVNVGRLAFTAPLTVRRSPFPGVIASAGDIFIQWNHPAGQDAHVFLCRREHGQPGGHIRDRVVTGRDGYLYCGPRRIQRWLKLDLCITDAAERGELDDVSFPEGFVPDTEPAPPMREDDDGTNIT